MQIYFSYINFFIYIYIFSFVMFLVILCSATLTGVICRRGITCISTVSLIFNFSMHPPQALAHCFNGFSNASQLTLSQRSGLGNGWCISGKIRKHKTSIPLHPQCFQDLEVMGEMEGGEFFDRAAEVMSHSL